MSFDLVQHRAARDSLLLAGGELVRYTDFGGDQNILCVISEEVESFGGVERGAVVERRQLAVFLTEDIKDPRRGDVIRRANGEMWMLAERQSTSGPYIHVWTAQQTR